MNYPLAVFSPSIGILSETFVERHITGLMPDRTVVVTYNMNVGYWKVNCPVFSCVTLQAGSNLKQNLRFLYNKALVKSFLQRNKVKVILGEFLNSSFDLFQISKELQIPFFAHAHGYDVSSMIRQPEWQAKYRDYQEAAGIITINQISRQRLIDLGIDAEKIHIIPCGVDIPGHPAKRVEREKIRCLAVGRMVTKKAPIFLLSSFYKAVRRNPNLHLDYVGQGDLLPAAKQFIEAFDLDDRVTLHQGKPHEFVQALMQGTDIFLQHSITDPFTGDEEGLPVSLLEAMAQGLPIVSTYHAGIPEAVLDGESGFLVNEGDCEAMADRLLTLAENLELRLKMGLFNWQRAKENFSWERERARLLEVMRLNSLAL